MEILSFFVCFTPNLISVTIAEMHEIEFARVFSAWEESAVLLANAQAECRRKPCVLAACSHLEG